MVRSSLLLLASFLLLQPLLSSALTLRLSPNSERCFYETVAAKGDKVVGTLNVWFGGNMEVDVKVLDPSKQVVYEQGKQREDTFTFFARQEGSYTICFSNTQSLPLMSTKALSFDLFSGHALSERDAAGSEHVSPLARAVEQLSEGIRTVHDATVYSKARERVHHRTVENTNSAVVWWRCFQIAAVLGVAAAKTIYITRMFGQRRAV